MKKVFYSIRKVRNSDDKISGLGFLNDEGTLFCKCVCKNGKRYTCAFDDVAKHCHHRLFLSICSICRSYLLKNQFFLKISSSGLPSLFFHSVQPFVDPPRTKSLAPLGVLNSNVVFRI